LKATAALARRRWIAQSGNITVLRNAGLVADELTGERDDPYPVDRQPLVARLVGKGAFGPLLDRALLQDLNDLPIRRAAPAIGLKTQDAIVEQIHEGLLAVLGRIHREGVNGINGTRQQGGDEQEQTQNSVSDGCNVAGER
jgi:hypothetical protein